MTDKKKKSSQAKAQTVSLSLDAEQIQGKNPILLFTASQIDEVLAEAEIQTLPFAAEHLIGLCAWREQVLPIINLVSFFGLIPSQHEEDGRYVVVRTVDNTSFGTKKEHRSGKAILRCILKVSDQIISGNLPTECKALLPQQAGFAPVFMKGLFQGEKELFLLPDLATIIHSNSVETTEK